MKKLIARCAGISIVAAGVAVTAIPASAGQKLLDASFETGLDSFAARATESVERTSEVANDGQYSLKISSRSSEWNGPVVALGSAWSAGETYSFSCAVYQKTGDAVAMKLSLQYQDGSGTNYAQIAEGSAASGTWTVLENASYQIPAGATDCYL